ncbi:hypothetical protein BC629DRAFT_1591057 [Irpex lacteus]|nr:hypothetical protein BC629DRAFT_1591057 [Irpex lacteus]
MAPLVSGKNPSGCKYRQTLLETTQVQLLQLAIRAKRRWVGPVSPQAFMKDLMPINEDKLAEYESKRDKIEFTLSCGQDVNNSKRASKHKRTSHNAFRDSIARHDLSPRVPFFIPAVNKKRSTRTSFSKEHHPEITSGPCTTRNDITSGDTSDVSNVPDQSSFSWSHETLIVEFKSSIQYDPFHSEEWLQRQVANDKHTSPVSFEKTNLWALKILGRLVLHARETFDHQQRTHVFQLLVTGNHARIVYIDHSGAIVSDRIDYEKEPGVLGEFFWRMNHMSDEARGLDSTAAKAGSGDEELFNSVISKFVANMKDPSHPQRHLPNAETTLDADYPVYRMTVQETPTNSEANVKQSLDAADTSQQSRAVATNFLVQRPISKAKSPFGRGTRGYIAVVAETVARKQSGKDVVHDEDGGSMSVPLFLKDTWRINYATLMAESEVYRILERHGVACIPRFVCGGDMRRATGDVQRTICADWAKKVRKRLNLSFADFDVHTHHRVVQRLAYPIESAVNSKEMVRAFYDVLGGKCNFVTVYD